MVTDTDIRRRIAPRSVWLGVLRGLTAVFGICSIAWAVFSVTVNHAEAPFAGAAWDILRGESFDSAKLSELKQQLDSTPADQLRPVALVDVAVIRLRLLEMKLTEGAVRAGSPDFDDLDAAFAAALSRNPSNSFLWFADYWLGRVRGDATDRAIKPLRMSYETGPNEAWIAQRRNPVALGNFSSLPLDLAEQALSEFGRLVRSGLYRDAANILAGPGWPVRQQLLSRLAPLDEADRYAMARELAHKNLDGVSVPGVPDERPSRPF
jgi:hypothetical protein